MLFEWSVVTSAFDWKQHQSVSFFIYLRFVNVRLLTPNASILRNVARYPSGPPPNWILISSTRTGSIWKREEEKKMNHLNYYWQQSIFGQIEQKYTVTVYYWMEKKTNKMKSTLIVRFKMNVQPQIRGISQRTFTDSHESSSHTHCTHTHTHTHASIKTSSSNNYRTRIFSLSLCNQFAFACQLTASTDQRITHQWWYTI